MLVWGEAYDLWVQFPSNHCSVTILQCCEILFQWRPHWLVSWQGVVRVGVEPTRAPPKTPHGQGQVPGAGSQPHMLQSHKYATEPHMLQSHICYKATYATKPHICYKATCALKANMLQRHICYRATYVLKAHMLQRHIYNEGSYATKAHIYATKAHMLQSRIYV